MEPPMSAPASAPIDIAGCTGAVSTTTVVAGTGTGTGAGTGYEYATGAGVTITLSRYTGRGGGQW